MWELPDDTATPRLAAALDAVGEGRADRAFDLALEAFLDRNDEVVGVFCAPEKPGGRPDPLRQLVRDAIARPVRQLLTDEGWRLRNHVGALVSDLHVV